MRWFLFFFLFSVSAHADCLPQSSAIFFDQGMTQCSDQVGITKNALSIGAFGTMYFPDGGQYNSSGFNISAPFAHTGTDSGLNLPFFFYDTNIGAGANMGAFLAPNISAPGNATIFLGRDFSNNDVAILKFNYNAPHSVTNQFCITFYGNNGCPFGVLPDGHVSTGYLSQSASGNTSSPAFQFTNCGSCGFNQPGAGQMQFVSGGQNIYDVGVSNPGTSFNLLQPIVPKKVTVAQLPTLATAPLGARLGVTDNVAACAYGTAPIGGGSNFCTVENSGSAWVIR